MYVEYIYISRYKTDGNDPNTKCTKGIVNAFKECTHRAMFLYDGAVDRNRK